MTEKRPEVRHLGRGARPSYLRYVEADLERNGRLWFGVTPDVKPADVPT